jgi:hypothetical protein
MQKKNGVEDFERAPAPAPVEHLWTSVETMRPTQGAVGYIEVAFKMRELAARSAERKSLKKYLKGHPIPAVRGPDGRMYLTDHHHMGLALCKLAEQWDAGDGGAGENPFRQCCFKVQADYSSAPGMSLKKFYGELEGLGLCHPYDGAGRRIAFPASSLERLDDDPYRSLAGLARKAGAFDKVKTAYAEFEWADFFRKQIPSAWICPERLCDAIFEASLLARSDFAVGLPGYKGLLGPLEEPSSVESIQARLLTKFGAADDDTLAWIAPSAAPLADKLADKLAGRRAGMAMAHGEPKPHQPMPI